MKSTDIADMRLHSQHIPQADFATARDVVSWMGAMQAQDYAGALWAIGLRTPDLTRADIEKAISNRKIIRTWPMRGTLHFVASEDIRWMQALLTPRVIASFAGRRKQLEIDDASLTRAETVLKTELLGGKSLTRNELYALFEAKNIATSGQRGIHMLGYFAHTGLLCLGAHSGKQPAYVLLDEWLAPAKDISRDEALGELAKRYFTSHGPATLKDFAGWSYLTMSNARRGIELAGANLEETIFNGMSYWATPGVFAAPKNKAAYLLPGFDEFILGYKDRSAILEAKHAQKIVPGNNGMFLPTVIIDGKVVGLWRKVIRKSDVVISLAPFEPLSQSDLGLLEAPAKRYGDFLGLPVSVNVQTAEDARGR